LAATFGAPARPGAPIRPKHQRTREHDMLDSNLKTQLQGYLERITQPVEIVASLDDSEKSREMLVLRNESESVSSRVKTDAQRDAAQIKPSFARRRPGADPQVRCAGVPMGPEF